MTSTCTINSQAPHNVSAASKLLSIAIPSYNVEAYLAKTLESFTDECFEDYLDVIVIDDGSCDATPQIAQSYAERYPSHIRLVCKENGGHGSAVNTGIQHAQGTFFRVLDGDDWMLKDNLLRFLDFLKTTNADAIIDKKSEVSLIDGSKELKDFSPFVKTLCKQKPSRFSELCKRHDIQEALTIHTLTVKTSLLKEHSISLLEHCFYVDYEFILKASSCINTIAFIDLEIYQYLVANTAQSTSAASFVKRYDNHQRVLEELLQYRDSFPRSLTAQTLSQAELDARMNYLFDRIIRLIYTQINIALIFDEDRNQGKARAQELLGFLSASYPYYARACKKRFKLAWVLHCLGFNENRLRKLMRRSSRS